MRRLLILLAVITAVPCGADLPCWPPTRQNVFVFYTGGASGCTRFGGTVCDPGEIITFEAKSFSQTFCPGQTFQWNFGDGSAIATGRMAAHAYAQIGVYVVQLTVANSAGTVSVDATLNIAHVDPPPPITYQALVIDGQRVPRGVRFMTYMSPGPWLWNFGDGTSARATRSEQDHIYPRGGIYTVTALEERSGQRFTTRIEIPRDRVRAVRH